MLHYIIICIVVAVVQVPYECLDNEDLEIDDLTCEQAPLGSLLAKGVVARGRGGGISRLVTT